MHRARYEFFRSNCGSSRSLHRRVPTPATDSGTLFNDPMASRGDLLVEAAIRFDSAARLLEQAAAFMLDEDTAESNASPVEPARPAAKARPWPKFIGMRMRPMPPSTPPPCWRPASKPMPKPPSATPLLGWIADEAAEDCGDGEDVADAEDAAILEEDAEDGEDGEVAEVYRDNVDMKGKGFYYKGQSFFYKGKGFYYTGKGGKGSKQGKTKGKSKAKGKDIVKSSSKAKRKGMTKGKNNA